MTAIRCFASDTGSANYPVIPGNLPLQRSKVLGVKTLMSVHSGVELHDDVAVVAS